jgi:hypothetical protein
MKINKRDEFLIIVSTVVAVLISKLADPILAHKYPFGDTYYPLLDLAINSVILIIMTSIAVVFVAYLTEKVTQD